jgi:hypothetical protein
MRSKAIKTIKKSLMNKTLPSLPIRHWTLELRQKLPNGIESVVVTKEVN